MYLYHVGIALVWLSLVDTVDLTVGHACCRRTGERGRGGREGERGGEERERGERGEGERRKGEVRERGRRERGGVVR